MVVRVGSSSCSCRSSSSSSRNGFPCCRRPETDAVLQQVLLRHVQQQPQQRPRASKPFRLLFAGFYPVLFAVFPNHFAAVFINARGSSNRSSGSSISNSISSIALKGPSRRRGHRCCRWCCRCRRCSTWVFSPLLLLLLAAAVLLRRKDCCCYWIRLHCGAVSSRCLSGGPPIGGPPKRQVEVWQLAYPLQQLLQQFLAAALSTKNLLQNLSAPSPTKRLPAAAAAAAASRCCWQRTWGLPEEVFVSLRDPRNADTKREAFSI